MHTPIDYPGRWPLRNVAPQRCVPIFAVALLCVIYAALTSYNIFFGFPPALWVARATDGFIQSGLVHTILLQILLVGGFLVGACRLTARELGLNHRQIPVALAATAVGWGLAEGGRIILHSLRGQELVLNPVWTDEHWHRGLGAWLFQLVGNAPSEEMIFRGFLLAQLMAQFTARRLFASSPRRLAAAVLISQSVFALVHVPMDWVTGRMWLLAVQFIIGIAFAAIYLWTGNLFVVMGVHVLSNDPAPVVQSVFDGDHFIGLSVLLLLVFFCRRSAGGMLDETDDRSGACGN